MGAAVVEGGTFAGGGGGGAPVFGDQRGGRLPYAVDETGVAQIMRAVGGVSAPDEQCGVVGEGGEGGCAAGGGTGIEDDPVGVGEAGAEDGAFEPDGEDAAIGEGDAVGRRGCRDQWRVGGEQLVLNDERRGVGRGAEEREREKQAED